VEVPLKRIGGVLLVASRINNQVATNFIVDTGASVVTISHAVADRLGLEYAGKPTQRLITPSGIMHSPRVVLDAVHVPDETGAGVSSVDAVVATVPGSPPDIGGLLGQSFLRNFHVTIDAERGVMHLQSVGAAAGISR
jgi:clan AA aspartic protease (TIGR02281 family)